MALSKTKKAELLSKAIDAQPRLHLVVHNSTDKIGFTAIACDGVEVPDSVYWVADYYKGGQPNVAEIIKRCLHRTDGS